ncbi:MULTISPECIES: GNAT family N-acetyltransferase [Brevibacterium]|jgi:ribosomal-protein-alanine N-acetyltransferase|uniref:GNAT family N-acetyltransferase n=1 Tax=Brevibacterium TaxID=1696 RepID=UPI0031DA29D2
MTAHLRSWSPSDAEALAEIYAESDPELQRNIPEEHTAAGASTWIESILTAEADGTARAFVIVDGTRILGNVMATGVERRHSTAWISYWLRPEARGQGLASSALRTLVDVLHDDLGVYRLELGYRVNNPASGVVAAAAGFLVEGRERQRLDYGGVRYDTEVAARLSGDPRAPGGRLPIAGGE